jgi:hypothetical protein
MSRADAPATAERSRGAPRFSNWFARLAIVLVVLVAFAASFALTPPRGARSMRRFDANRVADLELRMWQAYYAKHRVQLFALLATMLREQYHYSWATASRQAFRFARAAATFGDLRGNYDVVLPDLEAGYATTRSWMAAGFDPGAVARAELAWWVARRVPDGHGAEHVGELIADEYALLYETSRERVALAARLRADAAALRDAQADHPDWAAIALLLRQSYGELLMALSSENA